LTRAGFGSRVDPVRERVLLAIVVGVGCRTGGATTPADAAAPAPRPATEEAAAQEQARPEPAPPTNDPAGADGGEREQYERALATATSLDASCRRDPNSVAIDALVDAYAILAPYEQSPERDAAILALERCRQAVSKVVEKSLPRGGDDDFSAELETAIRKANARSAKNLTVTVEGSKVTIHKKGKASKKKKKDEKKALDGYCAMTSAPAVTRITVVTDEHGEMSCSPKFEFSKQSGYVDRRMGIAAPFEVESTEERKIPPSR
jgi:hypothetical protein